MMRAMIGAGLLWAVLAGAAAAPTPRVYDGNCAAPVSSPEDAMAKADFVIEGTVIAAIYPNEPHPPLGIAIEKVKVIRQQGDAVVDDITLSLTIGPCFAPGMEPFTFGEAGSVHGQRMRFFGNEHRFTDGRRFFYMMPADEPLPVADKARSPWALTPAKIKRYGKALRRPIRDGWHRARSTGGRLSVDLPGPYTDETVVRDGDTQFVLRAVDRRANRFSVAFVRSAMATSLEELFDAEMQKPDAMRSMFKGLPAVSLREVRAGSVLHSTMIRVPGGTVLFRVVTTALDEARSERARARLLESVTFP
jgi:hypothetical protein